MKEGIVNHNFPILANNQSAIIAEPSEGTLDLPSAFIATHFAAIMVFSLLVVVPIRADQFNPPMSQGLPQWVTIVTFVRNEPLWIFPGSTTSLTGHRDVCKRLVQELHFRWGRRVQVVSQRNTLAVDHHHPLRALAPAGFADAEPPFLAGAKLPSIKASDQSSWPRSSKSARNTRQALSQTPCSSQSFSRRQHVEGLGYFLGKSAHGAPVRRIHKIPSKTLRLSIQGRPPCLDFLGFGNSGLIFFHCVSVSFQRSFAIEKTPFNDKVHISHCLAQV